MESPQTINLTVPPPSPRSVTPIENIIIDRKLDGRGVKNFTINDKYVELYEKCENLDVEKSEIETMIIMEGYSTNEQIYRLKLIEDEISETLIKMMELKK